MWNVYPKLFLVVLNVCQLQLRFLKKQRPNIAPVKVLIKF